MAEPAIFSTEIEHGGQRLAAAQEYNIPVHAWVDLSTGINPNGWPVPEIPTECWQRLPEDEDRLLPAAQAYYQYPSILPVAGSQAAIQTLPLLRPRTKVGILSPGYAEHMAAWRKAGHQVFPLQKNAIASAIANIDVLVIINPNNPTGHLFTIAELVQWHQQLQQRSGWLIIDEAFIDCTPELSMLQQMSGPGLIILRSLGKFFGLAGIRCGFVMAEQSILVQLKQHLGPWTISTASRFIASAALQDRSWQQQCRIQLKQQSIRLNQLLLQAQLKPEGYTALYQWVLSPNALNIHQQLAQQGVLTRVFANPASIRFGLPKDEQQWNRLARALNDLIL